MVSISTKQSKVQRRQFYCVSYNNSKTLNSVNQIHNQSEHFKRSPFYVMSNWTAELIVTTDFMG